MKLAIAIAAICAISQACDGTLLNECNSDDVPAPADDPVPADDTGDVDEDDTATAHKRNLSTEIDWACYSEWAFEGCSNLWWQYDYC